MPLYIVEKIVGGILVLDVRGQITLGEETASFREKTKKLVDAGHTRIIVDLAEVHYIDSAGLATLVWLYTTVRKQGGNVKLMRLTKRVRGLMQITRLSTVFDTYEDLESAKQSFEAAP